jgi:hypothetical protein
LLISLLAFPVNLPIQALFVLVVGQVGNLRLIVNQPFDLSCKSSHSGALVSDPEAAFNGPRALSI